MTPFQLQFIRQLPERWVSARIDCHEDDWNNSITISMQWRQDYPRDVRRSINAIIRDDDLEIQFPNPLKEEFEWETKRPATMSELVALLTVAFP